MDHHEIQGKIQGKIGVLFRAEINFFFFLITNIGRDNFQRLKNSSIMSVNA